MYGNYPDDDDYEDQYLTKILEERGRLTPDMPELRAFKEIPIFVFDNLQKGKRDHYCLEGAKYYGKAHTSHRKFTMKTSDSVPYVFDVDSSSISSAYIRGEMYGVTPEHMVVLDSYHGNMNSSNRTLIPIVMEEQKPTNGQGMMIQKCFIWTGIGEVWDNRRMQVCSRRTYTHHPEPTLRNLTFYEHN